MDNQRLFLWIGLAAILFLNYEVWQRDYARPAATVESAPASTSVRPGATPAAGTPGAAAQGLADSLPSVGAPPSPAGPTGAAGASGSAPAPAAATAGEGGAAAAAATPVVHVHTDVLDLEIATRGGELRRADLLHYPQKKDAPNVPVRLLDSDSPDSLFVFQGGLTSGGGGPEPNHMATFTAAAADYTLGPGQAELVVPLTWSDGAGVTVTRSYRFRPGSYAIGLTQKIDNDGASAWRGRDYGQLLRHWQHAERSMWNSDTYAFKGPAVYDGHKYRTFNVEKPDPDALPKGAVSGGWAAAMQHHFVAALVPAANEAYEYSLGVKDREFLLRATGPERTVAPGSSVEFKQTLFVGPKLQDQLAAAGEKLELTADYGRLTIIAQPLFKLLSLVHRLIGNWGFTIIVVTLLIKLAFYPLAQTSGRSMAKMRSIAPRMKTIQERYKDDRAALGQQMMELYKREKVNPLAGCLPIVVQIPVFISFYWVLLESVEMRQAPWMLWVQDLSTRDPWFILPALMGASMFAQFKLNPAPPDPMQAKVFAFMPLVMTVMMAFFPAGLVLYWITNTVFSIAQQWRINKIVETEEKKARA